MSDRELAAVLAMPDHDEPSVDPADGQRLRATDADAAEAEADDDLLSPEDLVAEMVRQDRLEAGEDDEDDTDDEDDAEDDEDALREKARLYDEWQASKEQAEAEALANAEQAKLDRAHFTLHQQYQQAVTSAKAHYRAEKQKVIARVIDDSHNSPDPDAYRRLHLKAAIDNADQAQDDWIGRLDATYEQGVAQLRGRADELFHERNKPRFARELIAKFGLPDHPTVAADLLRVSDIRRMPERADELRRMHQQFLEMGRIASQGLREERAKTVKLTQPHPNATSSRPARQKPRAYTGAASELAAIEALR
jgi:hypothetical protein